MKLAEKLRPTLLAMEKQKFFFGISCIFKVLLEISYIWFVNPVFAYEGYVLELDLVKYVESWILFLVCLYFFPKRLKKPSDYLINYILFSFLCPLLVFYGLSGANRFHLYLVIFCAFLVQIFRDGKTIRFPVLKDGRKITLALLILGALVVTVWMFFSGGLRYLNFDLARVYEFREDAGNLLNQGIMGYVNVWATKVFGPILIAIFLLERRFLFALVVIILHVVWFAISSHKAVVFYPLLVTFLWAWFRNTKALSLVPFGMMLVLVISLGLFFSEGEIFFGSMFIRRLFFVPAQLTFTYYDFFDNNPYVYWSNTFGSVFSEYPYKLNTAELIGDYNGTGAAANNSFFSTGYMHAGIIGVVIYGVIVGFIFRLIDSICDGYIKPWFAIAAVIVPAQALIISADLPTAIGTHGIAVSIFFLFLWRKKENIAIKEGISS